MAEQSMRNVIINIIANIAGFTQGTNQVRNTLNTLGSTAQNANSQMSNSSKSLVQQLMGAKSELSGLNNGFNSLMSLARGAAGLYGGKKMFDWLTQGNMQFEEFQMSFEVVLKSADAAKKKMEYLWDFAAKTPYELPQVTQASLLLETFGMKTEDYLKQAGDLAAAFKATGASITEVAAALGRLKSGQYGEAFERLRYWGISYEKLKAEGLKFSKSNQYEGNADQAIKAVTKIIDKEFGGMMDKLSKTTSGRISTMKDEFAALGRDLGLGLTEKFGVMVDKVTKFLRDLSKRPEYAKMKRDFGDVAEDIGAKVVTILDYVFKFISKIGANWGTVKTILKDALIIFVSYKAIVGVTSVILGLVGAFNAVKTAITVANAAMTFFAANPAVAIIGGIIALLTASGVAYSYYKGSAERTSQANLDLINSYEDNNTSMQKNIRRVDELIAKQKSLTSEMNTLKTSIESKKLSTEANTKATGDLVAKQQEYAAAGAELTELLPNQTRLTDQQSFATQNLMQKESSLKSEIINLKAQLENKNLTLDQSKKLTQELSNKQNELTNVSVTLANTLPNTTNALDDQGRALSNNIVLNQQLRNEMVATIKTQYEIMKKKAELEIPNLEKKLKDEEGDYNRLESAYTGKNMDSSSKKAANVKNTVDKLEKIPIIGGAMGKVGVGFWSLMGDITGNKMLQDVTQTANDLQDPEKSSSELIQAQQNTKKEIDYLKSILNTKDFDDYTKSLNKKIDNEKKDIITPNSPTSSTPNASSGKSKTLFEQLTEKFDKQTQQEKLKSDIKLQTDELTGKKEGSLVYENDSKENQMNMLSIINDQKNQLLTNMDKFKAEEQPKAQIKVLELQKEANDILLQIQKNTSKVGEFNLPNEIRKMTLSEYKLQENPNQNRGVTIANAQIVLDIKEIPKEEEDILNMEDLLAQRLRNITVRGGGVGK